MRPIKQVPPTHTHIKRTEALSLSLLPPSVAPLWIQISKNLSIASQ